MITNVLVVGSGLVVFGILARLFSHSCDSIMRGCHRAGVLTSTLIAILFVMYMLGSESHKIKGFILFLVLIIVPGLIFLAGNVFGMAVGLVLEAIFGKRGLDQSAAGISGPGLSQKTQAILNSPLAHEIIRTGGLPAESWKDFAKRLGVS